MATSKKQYAVITHATSVFGRAFALELAKREINLVLISWPEEELGQTARDLIEFGIDVRFYETDLASHQNLADVAQWINLNFEVALVITINNSRRRVSKNGHHKDINYLNTISQLNIMSVSLLTRELLPNLVRQRKSYILSVSDVGVITSIDFMKKYRTLATFGSHFTRSLRKELRDTNVFVAQVYVNAMQKNIDVSDRESRFLELLKLPTPGRIAAISIRRLFRRQTAMMPGLGYSRGWFVMRIATIWRLLCSLTTFFKRDTSPDSAFGGPAKN